MRPFSLLLPLFLAVSVRAQQAPYDLFPPADPPYYRVRQEGSAKEGELAFAANYTVWIPPGVRTVRGLIVHQHGCGEGSCKSGLTGAFDLHWQALARRHDCALLSPAYEQPEKADCQRWCDPRQGSDAAFLRALAELGRASGHPELVSVPWALWGHSGGGLWAGGMVLLHPDRVVAAWLRSGVPAVTPMEGRPVPHAIPDAAARVPMMCNLGTREGVTDKTNRFAGVWPGVETFFKAMRAREALMGVAIDPLSSHECGNQRYLAIPWLDACLDARLPRRPGGPLRSMRVDRAWLAPLNDHGTNLVAPVPARLFVGSKETAVWLPDRRMARLWMEYVRDTAVSDTTPPPAPRHLRVAGRELRWEAEADIESGLARFEIERDGRVLAIVPDPGRNPYGRPVFQNLQYSDTPTHPLVEMRYVDSSMEAGRRHRYRVFSVNTAGLRSRPSAGVVAGDSGRQR